MVLSGQLLHSPNGLVIAPRVGCEGGLLPGRAGKKRERPAVRDERGPTMERPEKSDGQSDVEPTEEAVHGGREDPLGGGVAELDDSDEVTEGIPEQ